MNWTMKIFNTAVSSWMLGIVLLLGACEQVAQKESRVNHLPYYRTANFTPHWIEPGDAVLDTFHQVSPFKLLNQEGDTISEATFAGKIYVTDFFFTTCPGICPKMMANMSVIQESFLKDDDVLLLSHSVTPERDSVAVLKSYAHENGIVSQKWHLATGDRQVIYKLGRKAYFVEEDLGLEREIDEFLHTENFVLIDHNRHIRGIYNGLNKASVKQLIADIHTLKEEGSLLTNTDS